MSIFFGGILFLISLQLALHYHPKGKVERLMIGMVAAMSLLAFAFGEGNFLYFLIEGTFSGVVILCARKVLRNEAKMRMHRYCIERYTKQEKTRQARVAVRSRMQEDRVAAAYFGGHSELTFFGRCA
ncbi:hypothetical protein ACVS9P_00395 [Caproicibacterium sp. NSD3]